MSTPAIQPVMGSGLHANAAKPLRKRLSRSEIAVLTLIARGYSSQEAADNLFVSKRTVDFHLHRAYAKLDVSNRMQACAAAIRIGIISRESVLGEQA